MDNFDQNKVEKIKVDTLLDKIQRYGHIYWTKLVLNQWLKTDVER